MECEIAIGDNPPNKKNIDCYWFNEDITETELIAEIKELKHFYEQVWLPTVWPPHIRERKVAQI